MILLILDTLLLLYKFVGTKEAVDAAKVIVEARVKELDNIVEDSVTVDPKHHKHFAARGGAVLRMLSDEFGGVVISFPSDGDGDEVLLKGARNCIDAAIARIKEIVKDLYAGGSALFSLLF